MDTLEIIGVSPASKTLEFEGQKTKKKAKLNVLQKNAIRFAFIASAVVACSFIASPARAEFDEEVEKVNVMSNTVAGIVSAMTDVAILPMGISASMRTFRHIVLANV